MSYQNKKTAEELSLFNLSILNRQINRLLGDDSQLEGNSSEKSFHLLEIQNHLIKEKRVFNALLTLSILTNLEKHLNATELWNLLISVDPKSPPDSKYYFVTFIQEDSPYLEWRWIGGETVQKRLAVYESDRLFPWQTIKTAELYHHFYNKSGKSRLAMWLESLGFTLTKETLNKWGNIVPGEEILLFTSTGPTLVFMDQELEIPEKGWCHITREERIASSSDGAPQSEIEEITSKWETWLYYGYVVDSEISEIFYD